MIVETYSILKHVDIPILDVVAHQFAIRDLRNMPKLFRKSLFPGFQEASHPIGRSLFTM